MRRRIRTVLFAPAKLTSNGVSRRMPLVQREHPSEKTAREAHPYKVPVSGPICTYCNKKGQTATTVSGWDRRCTWLEKVEFGLEVARGCQALACPTGRQTAVAARALPLTAWRGR